MGLVSLLKGKKAVEKKTVLEEKAPEKIKSMYFPGLGKKIIIKDDISQTNEAIQENIEIFFNSELIDIIGSSLINNNEFNDPNLITDYYLRTIDETLSELEKQKNFFENEYKNNISETKFKIKSKISEKESLAQKLEQNKVDPMNINLVNQLIKDLETSISSYSKEIEILEHNLKKDKNFIKGEMASLDLARKYPLIDLSFMHKHKETVLGISIKGRPISNYSIDLDGYFFFKLPKLTPFKYGSDKVSFSYSRYNRNFDDSSPYLTSQHLIERFGEFYDFKNKKIDQLRGDPNRFRRIKNTLQLEGEEGSECTFTLESKFNYLIPETVTERIEEAKKYFGDEIYILSESEWEIKKVKTIPKETTVKEKDPIVIGLKDFNSKRKAYFITAFDPTPYENYVINQNVGNKPGKN